MATLGPLIRILKPPARPLEVPVDDVWWAALSRALGVPLPADWKTFVQTYGTGSIARFITIANPFSEIDPYLPWLTSVIAADKNSMVVNGKGVAGGLPPFPASEGLLPFGRWSDWAVLYFHMRGAPDAWPIVFASVHGDYQATFEVPLSTFLDQVLRGKLRDPAFGVEYPRSERAKFTSGGTR
ncbi:MAG: SMI1/KNR4 family protein [Deltaproteobacteria bacterium]|nr:SMI1/KNR4 family protein [Deltaproteobacteria bacterium]